MAWRSIPVYWIPSRSFECGRRAVWPRRHWASRRPSRTACSHALAPRVRGSMSPPRASANWLGVGHDHCMPAIASRMRRIGPSPRSGRWHSEFPDGVHGLGEVRAAAEHSAELGQGAVGYRLDWVGGVAAGEQREEYRVRAASVAGHDCGAHPRPQLQEGCICRACDLASVERAGEGACGYGAFDDPGREWQVPGSIAESGRRFESAPDPLRGVDSGRVEPDECTQHPVRPPAGECGAFVGDLGVCSPDGAPYAGLGDGDALP